MWVYFKSKCVHMLYVSHPLEYNSPSPSEHVPGAAGVVEAGANDEVTEAAAAVGGAEAVKLSGGPV